MEASVSLGIFTVSSSLFLLLFNDPVTAVCTSGTVTLEATDFIIGRFENPSDGSTNYGQNLDLCWKVTANSAILAGVSATIGPSDYLRTYDATSSSGAHTEEIEDSIGRTNSEVYPSQSLFVRFTTDGSTDVAKDLSIKVEYIAGPSTACNTDQTARAATQYFTSPNFPNRYPGSQTCTYTITAGSGNTISASVIFQDIEQNCERDYLQITDPSSGESYEKQCSRTWETTQTVISKGNSLRVDFVTDPFTFRYGWVISYKEIEASSDDSPACGDGCIAGAVVGSLAGTTAIVGGIFLLAKYKGLINFPSMGNPKIGNIGEAEAPSIKKTANGNAEPFSGETKANGNIEPSSGETEANGNVESSPLENEANGDIEPPSGENGDVG